MDTVISNFPAVEIRAFGPRAIQADRLTIRASADGWSLIGAGGQVVFRGLGPGSRRECLEFARRRGALAVFS